MAATIKWTKKKKNPQAATQGFRKHQVKKPSKNHEMVSFIVGLQLMCYKKIIKK